MFVCLYVCSFIDLVVCLFVCLLGCLFGSVLGPSEFDGGIALMPSCRDGLRQKSSEIPRIGLISTGPRDHFPAESQKLDKTCGIYASLQSFAGNHRVF